MKKKKVIIDVNQCPVIRNHKKSFCPRCDKNIIDCKCKKTEGGK